jgi:hypothetical protein
MPRSAGEVPSSVSYAAMRGEALVETKGYQLIE